MADNPLDNALHAMQREFDAVRQKLTAFEQTLKAQVDSNSALREHLHDIGAAMSSLQQKVTKQLGDLAERVSTLEGKLHDK